MIDAIVISDFRPNLIHELFWREVLDIHEDDLFLDVEYLEALCTL